MQEAKSRKPKVVLCPRCSNQPLIPGLIEDDFAIYAWYRINVGSVFVGRLKVV
jgi:hypothetical protein